MNYEFSFLSLSIGADGYAWAATVTILRRYEFERINQTALVGVRSGIV